MGVESDKQLIENVQPVEYHPFMTFYLRLSYVRIM
jgi:hypothetical protein